VLDPDGLAGRAYVDATEELLFRLDRQNRPGTRLPPALGHDEALNRLREWRATVHAALLRMPTDGEGWAKRAGGSADDDDDDQDDPYFGSAPRAQPLPAPRHRLGLLLLLAGFAAGMALEALTGVLRRLLG